MMQNKKSKAQIKKQIRHMHERVAALVLTLGLMAGASVISHDARRTISGLAIHPVFAVIEHNTKETETARHEAILQGSMRSMPVSGTL